MTEALKKVYYSFPEQVTSEQVDEAIQLMNTVANEEMTVGYCQTLSKQQEEVYKSWIHAQMEGDDSYLLVGTVEGRLVSIAALNQPSGENNRHLVTALRAIIHPDYRGRVTVKAGLLALAEKAREIGAEIMLLDSTKGSRAESTWKHFGFIQYGELPFYSNVRNEMKPGIYMYQTVESLIQHTT